MTSCGRIHHLGPRLRRGGLPRPGTLALVVLLTGLTNTHAFAQTREVSSDTLYGWRGMSMTFAGTQQVLLQPLEARAQQAGLPFASGTPLTVGFGGALWMGRWQLMGSSTLLYAGSKSDNLWNAKTRGAAGTVQIGYAVVGRRRTRLSVTTGLGRSSVRSAWTPRQGTSFDEVLDVPAQSTTIGIATWHARAGVALEHRVVLLGERVAFMANAGWQGPVSGETRSVADERVLRGAPRSRQEGVYLNIGIGLPIRARDAVFAALGSALPGGSQ